MYAVDIAHYIFLGALFTISILTLAFSGNLTGNWAIIFNVMPDCISLDLAVAVITLVVVIPSAIINFFRRGAFTSMVAVEIGWTSLLTVLWVAAAGDTTSQFSFLPTSCNYVADDDGVEVTDQGADSLCRQAFALEAMSWLGFISLLAWLVTLVTLAAISHSRGHSSVWTESVNGANFTQRATRPEKPQTNYQQNPSTQPMLPQYTGYSQQQYPPYPTMQPQPVVQSVMYKASPAPYNSGVAQV